jgi:transcription initiation factor TFIIIB Brf1 subunit/transcription initiation factor TFIIB
MIYKHQTLTLMYKPCKVCKNRDQGLFVEDQRAGDLICTICGAVQSGANISMNNTIFSEPIANIPPTREDNKLLRINEQMINRICPDEFKEFKRNKTIDDFCDKLELLGSIKSKAKLLLKKHHDELCKIRPTRNLIASCVIISCQITKRYINVKDVELILDLEHVNVTLKAVCKTIGINQRAIVLNSVPHLTSFMSLPFKFEQKLRDLYNLTCSKNPSMGGETRMALCCYKIYNDNIVHAVYKGITLDNIANVTNTSENSLKSYISGKTKNSLFEKKRKRNEVINDVTCKQHKTN